jgi:hypothetical protein
MRELMNVRTRNGAINYVLAFRYVNTVLASRTSTLIVEYLNFLINMFTFFTRLNLQSNQFIHMHSARTKKSIRQMDFTIFLFYVEYTKTKFNKNSAP